MNNLSNNKKLVFLIHGYNNTGESASLALEKLRVEVIKKFPHEKFQFVEVYWDGLTKRDNPLNSTTIWNNAQYSSSMAGLGLRKILINIKNKENYVITHSHGASVITEALFNVRRFDDKYYITNYNGKEIANLQAIYNTPTSKFSVGMLAPAIPGYNVFHEYYDRTVEGSSVVTTMTNYRFVNGFNKYDVATTKGFLAGSFGATTLACREDDHLAVQAFFKNDSKIYSRINFSEDKNNKQRSHAVVAYIENPNFNTFLISVIE
ncbi:alpha/beta hydrolase [Chryseobacterium sp. PvR013]|uniref:alpha/beta hydrolase n=1 Tax=Chryseobacterium sp. PvR013 TaxID=2806595 RepID=UPI0032AFF7B9